MSTPASLSESPAAVRDKALDALFAPRTEGYLGADGALSVPLDRNRAVWIFGDTLFGCLATGKRAIQAMPRNTIAVVDHRSNDPRSIDWLTSPSQKDADFFRLPKPGTWFWPGNGITHEGKLYLFGYAVEDGSGPVEALSFRVLGSQLLRVGGIDGPPAQWTCESLPLRTPWPATMFGSACLQADDQLILMGLRHRGDIRNWQSETVMGRLPLSALDSEDPGASIECLVARDGSDELQWVANAEEPTAIYEPGVTECSLYRDAPRGRYLATTYRPNTGRMMIAVAPTLQGPWSEPRVLFDVPEFAGSHRHLAYAFRMHPHLAAHPDETVCTYVVNTMSLETLSGESGVYYPRFVRVDLRTF